MLKLKTFISESYVEMRDKVTWPPYGELQNSTILVIVGCLVFTAMIGLMDLSFDSLMKFFYGQF
ncbi:MULTISPECIES: preprotein translocase subunit SecE [Persicobacter]|uniref:Protein translocase subunit SecE n=1 Tax=Persicobacter diffluens TaxID=981 RepID=A0AAN5AKG8_9BACT|nr:hypothetical protein PEDI_26310 [Persicobacter diffluens]